MTQVEEEGIIGFFPETDFQEENLAKRAKRRKVLPTINWGDFLSKTIPEEKEVAEPLEEPEKAINFQEYIDKGQEIATVRKEDVFNSEITEEEQKIIEQRVALQRQQFQEFFKREETKKVRKIRVVHPYVTYEEAVEALKMCKEDENETTMFLTDQFNLMNVRKAIALSHEPIKTKAPKSEENNDEDEENEEEEEHFVSRKRKNKVRKNRRSSTSKEGSIFRKLRLDEALKQGNMEGWSEARKKAYDLRDVNPNAYYYRFNDPGEEQRSGGWTKEEISMFFKRMEEVGVNGQWGIFSMTIPGRVGYQCSNFYRHLIVSGKIKDPNYVIDENGRPHYLFKGKSRKRKGEDGEEESGEGGQPSSSSSSGPKRSAGRVKKAKKGTKGRKKKKKNADNSDDEDGDDEDDEYDSDDDYRPSGKSSRNDNDSSHGSTGDACGHAAGNNPMPGFIDRITLDEVVKPALSPYGHVLSYDTWLDCLKSTNFRCPITKKPLKPRELTILTWDNIDQHRSKIIDLS